MGAGAGGAGDVSGNGGRGAGCGTAGSTDACAAPVNPFPPVNLKNFTASSPTTADVNAFLKQAWGFDDSRIWSVAAILKTQAPGVARVVVFSADKAHPDKLRGVSFSSRRMGSTRLRAG